MGWDLLSGATVSVVFVAGQGRDKPPTYEPAPLTAEVRQLIDEAMARAPQPDPAPAQPSGPPHKRPAYSKDLTAEQIEELLGKIDPRPLSRDEWLQVGMSVHDWDPGAGYAIWDRWNQQDPARYQERENARTWGSFKPGRTTAGTLVHMAGGIPAEWKAAFKKARKSAQGSGKGKGRGKAQGKGKGPAPDPRWIIPGDTSQDGYWATGPSMEMALAALGHAVRYNARAARVEICPIERPAAPDGWVASLGSDIHDPADEGWHKLDDTEAAWLISELYDRVGWQAWTYGAEGERIPIVRAVDFKPGTGWRSFGQALMAAVWRRRFDPVERWLADLPPWDNAFRLPTFLHDGLGVAPDDHALAKTAFQAAMIGAVVRTREPGSKHDQALLLIGEHGLGKSSLMELLCPFHDWHVRGVNPAAPDKQLIEKCGNAVFAELSELTSSRLKSIEDAKDALSAKHLSARLAYGHTTTTHAVRHVYYATSNKPDPLPQDRALARRFIPIQIMGKGDTKSVYERLKDWMEEPQPDGSTRREQLWAEAVFWAEHGASSYVPEWMYKIVAWPWPTFTLCMARSWLTGWPPTLARPARWCHTRPWWSTQRIGWSTMRLRPLQRPMRWSPLTASMTCDTPAPCEMLALSRSAHGPGAGKCGAGRCPQPRPRPL